MYMLLQQEWWLYTVSQSTPPHEAYAEAKAPAVCQDKDYLPLWYVHFFLQASSPTKWQKLACLACLCVRNKVADAPLHAHVGRLALCQKVSINSASKRAVQAISLVLNICCTLLQSSAEGSPIHGLNRIHAYLLF